MKYIFKFKLDKPLSLPIQYNAILQGALLKWLDDESYQKFIHDEGFSKGNRVYKLYSFSKLFGKYHMDYKVKQITFTDEVHLYISSYDKRYLDYLIQNIIHARPLILGKRELALSGLSVVEEPLNVGEDGMASCQIQTLSPITVASTLESKEGIKKTYYYGPMEKEFSLLVQSNLVNKYMAYYQEEPKDKSFSISPLNRYTKESITWYKKFLIKGWSGKFILKGSREMMEMALNAGIGSRNSIGYGCIILDNKREG